MTAACFAIGYLLVYAAVANQGRFATSPWDSLWVDAYDASGVSA